MTLLDSVDAITGLRIDMVGQMSYGFHSTDLAYCLTSHRTPLIYRLLQPVPHLYHRALSKVREPNHAVKSGDGSLLKMLRVCHTEIGVV
jgi:hypothetical protein